MFPDAFDPSRVRVTAFPTGTASSSDSHIRTVVQRVLQSQGHLFALRKLASLDDGVFRAVAEFCDLCAAVKAMENYAGTVVDVG
jgi:hypothetical protein